MLHKLRQRSAYYATLTTAVGLLLSVVLYGLLQVFHVTSILKLDTIEFIKYAAGIGLLTSILGAGFLDKLKGSSNWRLHWAFNQPFVWQFLAYVLTAIVVLAIIAVLKVTWPNDFISCCAIGFNAVYSLFGFYITYRFLKMIFKKA